MDIELKGFFSDDDNDIVTIATQSLLFKRENEELPTDTLAQQKRLPSWLNNDLRESRKKKQGQCGVVVKLLAYGVRGPGSISGLAATIPEILIATQSLLFKRENEELPTATSTSRFGLTITVAELAKQQFARIPKKKPGAVVV